MPQLPLTTTEQTAKSEFRSHGRVEYAARDRILDSAATGPFNGELMAALFDLAKATFPAMAAQGQWVNIAVIHESAMCAPEVLASLTDALKQLVSLGVAPAATAYVFAPGVEGASIMGPLFAKCYREAGLLFQTFKNADEAQAWVDSILDSQT